MRQSRCGPGTRCDFATLEMALEIKVRPAEMRGAKPMNAQNLRRRAAPSAACCCPAAGRRIGGL